MIWIRTIVALQSKGKLSREKTKCFGIDFYIKDSADPKFAFDSLIQAVLGSGPINDFGLSTEATNIMKICKRLSICE